ncbi:hypothetical protein ACEZDB_02260 [Streptacidiphilus sp. N1-3]|uniref:Uncharacterized protein n=1 Tax=Streptacidiphilus alkalitolerans TaxID=3342712 RepID=A0ABV6WU07_9ACTN
MDVIEASAGELTIRLSRDEATIINNALNELCNGFNISDTELETRIGTSRADIRALLSEVNAAIPA